MGVVYFQIHASVHTLAFTWGLCDFLKWWTSILEGRYRKPRVADSGCVSYSYASESHRAAPSAIRMRSGNRPNGGTLPGRGIHARVGWHLPKRGIATLSRCPVQPTRIGILVMHERLLAHFEAMQEIDRIAHNLTLILDEAALHQPGVPIAGLAYLFDETDRLGIKRERFSNLEAPHGGGLFDAPSEFSTRLLHRLRLNLSKLHGSRLSFTDGSFTHKLTKRPQPAETSEPPAKS